MFLLQDGMAHSVYPRYWSVCICRPLKVLCRHFIDDWLNSGGSTPATVDSRGVDTGHLQRSVNHPQLLNEIKRPLLPVASYGHAVVPRNQITRHVQGIDKLRGLLHVYGAQPLIGVLTGRWLPGLAACELRLAVRGLTPSGAKDRFA
jgi:hypothetical protein